jgi:hypothetical protein
MSTRRNLEGKHPAFIKDVLDLAEKFKMDISELQNELLVMLSLLENATKLLDKLEKEGVKT